MPVRHTALASDWRLTQRLLLTLAIWLCLGLFAPAAAWTCQPDPNRPGHSFLDNLDQRFCDRAYLGLTCAVCHTRELQARPLPWPPTQMGASPPG